METHLALNEFEIVLLKTGVKSLRSLVHSETFHPVTGPLIEANILHVGQQRLLERSAVSDPFIIWDVGFGAAANVLAAISALNGAKDGASRGITNRIEIHSFDKTCSPIEFALNHSSDLDYLIPYQWNIAELLKLKKTQISPHIQWNLHLGDFREYVKNPYLPAPHAVFYDPYSPVGNPEMWTLEHFSLLRQCLNSKTPCLLTNYTRSTAVRVTLLLAGFYVGLGCEVGEKAETTVVSNQYSLLRRPLDRKWLERVRNSTNAAPMRSLTYSKSRISESDFEHLQNCPQFNIPGPNLA